VRNFVQLSGDKARGQECPRHADLNGIQFASIGPITSATLRELSLPVHLEAREYTIPGLIQAIIKTPTYPPVSPNHLSFPTTCDSAVLQASFCTTILCLKLLFLSQVIPRSGAKRNDEEPAFPQQHRCLGDKQVPRRWRSSE